MEKYIKYQKFGMGHTKNLIYSFILHWGDKGTFASNQYIVEMLEVSVKTVSRNINYLIGEGFIIVENPSGKRRKLIVNLSNQPGHSVHTTETFCPSNLDNLSPNIDKMSNNIIEDIIDDEIENEIDDIIEEEALECINEYLSSRGINP